MQKYEIINKASGEVVYTHICADNTPEKTLAAAAETGLDFSDTERYEIVYRGEVEES